MSRDFGSSVIAFSPINKPAPIPPQEQLVVAPDPANARKPPTTVEATVRLVGEQIIAMQYDQYLGTYVLIFVAIVRRKSDVVKSVSGTCVQSEFFQSNATTSAGSSQYKWFCKIGLPLVKLGVVARDARIELPE
jgi:hypothetical protein